MRCLDSYMYVTGNMPFYFSAPFLNDYRRIHDVFLYVSYVQTHDQLCRTYSPYRCNKHHSSAMSHRTMATATNPENIRKLPSQITAQTSYTHE